MQLIEEVKAELERAINKFPTWPTDPLHALAVLGEEYGELNKAMLQLVYEPHKTTAEDVRMEAIQTAAMSIRLAMSRILTNTRGAININNRISRMTSDEQKRWMVRGVAPLGRRIISWRGILGW
ncbi:MAG: hypothetical protein IPK79_14450 [Vampirovibrionales bacterium]|nr:hypothetical protein [Vampirovibrionales bacterium]